MFCCYVQYILIGLSAGHPTLTSLPSTICFQLYHNLSIQFSCSIQESRDYLIVMCLLSDNGELRAFKGMSGMQAEKEKGKLFTKFHEFANCYANDIFSVIRQGRYFRLFLSIVVH